MTDIASGEPGMVQAKTDRTFGELMRVVEFRLLAVLDAIEPFLLDGGDERAVDEQRGGQLVIHRVDSKDVHRPTSTRVTLPLRKRRLDRRVRAVHQAKLAALLVLLPTVGTRSRISNLPGSVSRHPAGVARGPAWAAECRPRRHP